MKLKSSSVLLLVAAGAVDSASSKPRKLRRNQSGIIDDGPNDTPDALSKMHATEHTSRLLELAYFEVRSDFYSSMCLEVQWEGTAYSTPDPFTSLQLRPCNGSPMQTFSILENPGHIRSALEDGTYCLEGDVNPTEIQPDFLDTVFLYSNGCVDTWSIYSDGTAVNGGFCLASDGSEVSMQVCDGRGSQKWSTPSPGSSTSTPSTDSSASTPSTDSSGPIATLPSPVSSGGDSTGIIVVAYLGFAVALLSFLGACFDRMMRKSASPSVEATSNQWFTNLFTGPPTPVETGHTKICAVACLCFILGVVGVIVGFAVS
jgi:hypothetical protein